LSNARAEASAPGPVKAMRRASSHALDGSVLALAAVEREQVHARRLALERRHHRGKLRRSCGKEVRARGSLELRQLLARDAVDRPRRSEEPGLRLVEHAETFCADATETRRSLLVPPKRMLTSEQT